MDFSDKKFSNLEHIVINQCNHTNIENVDISTLHNLKYLNLSNNLIKSLDLTHNINLTSLLISNSELSEINLNNNLKLEKINLENNRFLKSINLSNQKEIKHVSFFQNEKKKTDPKSEIILPLSLVLEGKEKDIIHYDLYNTVLKTFYNDKNIYPYYY
jgi:hypothetical protein